jgi:hypothetical protein
MVVLGIVFSIYLIRKSHGVRYWMDPRSSDTLQETYAIEERVVNSESLAECENPDG